MFNREHQQVAKQTYQIFLKNPFDARLRTHKIHALSAKAGRIIYTVEIAMNLRAVFFIRGNDIISFDIGTHDIYKG